MALYHLWIFLIVILYQTEAHKHKFRRDYFYSAEYQTFYKVHKGYYNWFDAKRKCQYEGAHLFFPETVEEADYIKDYLYGQKNLDFPYIWLGINDIVAEGEYESVTGVFTEDLYINWENGEPNNVDDDEDCLIYTKYGRMNDMPCNRIHPFVCKKIAATVEWNSLCELPDSGYFYNKNLDKCYKFHLKPVAWDRAKETCENEQSYLTIINSQEEADFLRNFTAAAPKERFQGNYLAGAIHLGFYKEPKEETGKFITIAGTTLEEAGYTKWSYNQPDHPASEFCGSMFYDGELNDIPCDSRCYFICEHDLES